MQTIYNITIEDDNVTVTDLTTEIILTHTSDIVNVIIGEESPSPRADIASTDELPEGITNFYYTDARVDTLVDKPFIDALNVDADTLDGLDSTAFSLSGHTHVSADITDATPLNTPSTIVERDASGNFAAEAITATSYNADHIDFDITAGYNVTEGQMAWNADDGCVDIGLDNDVILQVGQEQHMHTKAASAITDGEIVYASGAVGASGKIEVTPFIADNSISEIYVIGVATQNISIGNFGYITTFGVVRGIITDGSAEGETWIDGTILYASPSSAGQLTNVKPTAPDPVIIVAMVVSAQATNGSLFIRPDRGYHLNDLHDVAVTSVASGEILKWTGTLWENNTLSEAGIQAHSTILDNTTASFTTADETKLDGIETNATTDQTAAELLTAIKTVDGTGSGLDSDLLDGQEGAYYLDYTNATNTPTLYTSFDFNSDLDTKTTTDLSEGTNLYFTDERVDDRVNGLLVAGSNITLTYDDPANTLTIASTGGSGGGTIDSLTDVTITTVTDNEVLSYDNGTSQWINNTLTEAGISATGHTHVASNITDFDTEVANNSAVTLNTAKLTNVTTNLGYTTAASTGTVTSSDGTDATLPAATTSLAGLLTGADKTKLDGIDTGSEVNVDTNLGKTVSGTAYTITSSTGTNVSLTLADTTNWGLMSDEMFDKLDGIETSATTDQTAGEIEAIVSHDNLQNIVANEHIDWSLTNVLNIHTDNYTNTTYNVGDGGLTEINFTTADNIKLDGIEALATADQTKTDIDALNIAASTAATLATARNIALTGDVTGSASFDGSTNINIVATSTTTIPVQDEGTGILTAPDAMNFVGGGVTVTDTAGVATITITGAAAAGTIITQDEGTNIDTAATTVNFVGAGVTATDAGSNVTTVTIPGGGSGTLDGLTDTTITAIATDELLKWSGTAWINNTLTEAGISATGHTHVATDITDFDTEVSNNTSVVANTAKVTNVVTNLGYTAATASGTVTSSDGTDATLPASTPALAGLMIATDKVKLNNIETNATADQTAGEIEAIVSHDNLIGVAANEHIDWTTDQGATNVHAGNYTDTNTTYVSSDFTHNNLTGFVADEHIDWSLTNVKFIHADNYTDTTYVIADGQLSEISFTSADNIKLDGIEASANNYTHPTGDGNLHVPANGTTNDTRVLTASAVAGVYTWELPAGGATTFDGLTDTTITTITANELLKWNGSAWVNNTLVEAGIQAQAAVLDNTTASYTIAEETKLAGIETNATADQTAGEIEAVASHNNLVDYVANEHIDWSLTNASNIHADNYTDTDTTYTVGDGGLTEINFTSADNIKLDGIEALADVTDTANVTAAGAVMSVSKSASITNPTATEDVTMFYTVDAITISQITSIVRGTTPSVTFTLRHNTDRSAAGTEVVTGGITTTNTTTGVVTTTFNSASIPANSWIWLETTALGGTVSEFHASIEY